MISVSLESKTFAGTESCWFVKIDNVPKGGSTGSADTPEGVKNTKTNLRKTTAEARAPLVLT